MSDLKVMTDWIRQRVRAEVEAINHDDVADALPEQLRSVAIKPSIYVMIRMREAKELSPGIKTQKIDLDVVIGIVTMSLIGNAAAAESTVLKQLVARSLHWEQPPGTLERLKFRGEPQDPVHDGSSVGSQLLFHTSMQETWT